MIVDLPQDSKWEKEFGRNQIPTKIMASGPITSWQIDGETVETVADFIFLGSILTAAMKLKDAYSLEGKF